MFFIYWYLLFISHYSNYLQDYIWYALRKYNIYADNIQSHCQVSTWNEKKIIFNSKSGHLRHNQNIIRIVTICWFSWNRSAIWNLNDFMCVCVCVIVVCDTSNKNTSDFAVHIIVVAFNFRIASSSILNSQWLFNSFRAQVKWIPKLVFIFFWF